MQLEKDFATVIDPHDVHTSLVADGIFTCHAFISCDRLRQLQTEFDRLFSERTTAVSPGQHPSGAMRRLKTGLELRRSFPVITDVFQSTIFREIAARYLPDGSTFNDSIVATHDFKPGKITDTHFDSLRTLKFFIYLTDTDASNGAFWYAPGTHIENSEYRRRFVEQGGRLLDLQNIPSDVEKIALEQICGAAGTLIIFDTDGFHSAGQVTNPDIERKVLRARSSFGNQPRIHPRKLSPMWFRRKLGVLPPHVPEKIPGRQASGGSARRRSGH